MMKCLSALVLAGAGCLLTGEAMAEPVKLAIIESLSGGQAAVGKMFLTAVNYGLIMAASAVATIPMLIAFVIGQRKIIASMAASGLGGR